MGEGYSLVNQTKCEVIGFLHVPATKKRELAGNPAAAAITTWYLLENIGDDIAFVSDTFDDWPFSNGNRKEMSAYTDVTDRVIESLIEQGVLADHGMSYVDPDEPDTIYERDLRNAWMPPELK